MSIGVRRLAASAILAVAPIGLTLVWLVVRADLPARLATHFSFDGTPDDFQRAGAFAAWLLPLVAVTALAGVVLVARVRLAGVPIFVGLLGYLAWLFAAVGVDTLLSARGVADPTQIRSGWTHLVPVLLIGILAGLVVWRLTPPGPRPDLAAEDVPVYEVVPGERVVWLGRSSSAMIGLFAGVLIAAGAVLLGVAWVATNVDAGVLLLLGGVLLLTGLIVGWCRSVDVRVDNDGVLVRLGGLPWPAFRTPIDRIEAASAEQIDPMSWGGWGYRFSGRGTAIVLRDGPGIVLHRRGKTDFAITVDGAETGAGLINGLIAARRD